MKKHYLRLFTKAAHNYHQHWFPKTVLLFCSLFLLMIGSTDLQGQQYVPFPSSNAIWSEVFTNQQPFEIETYQYGLSGDTLINAVLYHKVFRLADTIYPIVPEQYCGAIREDGTKRIFITGSECTYPGSGEVEVLLYDFSKSVGDTVFVGIDGTGPDGAYLILSTIDSLLIDGNYRKTFHFSGAEAYWIEGIGSTRGLLSNIQSQPSGFQKWELICFNQDNDVKYLNPEYNTCFPILTEINNKESVSNTIKIFPHPVTDISVIDLTDIAGFFYQYIDLYNIFGQQVNRINIGDKEQVLVRKHNYKSGMYVYRILGQNMKPVTGKIIFE